MKEEMEMPEMFKGIFGLGGSGDDVFQGELIDSDKEIFDIYSSTLEIIRRINNR